MNEPKASRYHRLRRRAACASAALSATLLCALALTPGSAWLRDLSAGSAAACGALLALLHDGLLLPLAWYRTNALEREYGLSRVTVPAWLRDQAKASLLAAGIAAIGTELLYGAIGAWPRWWWPAAAVGGAALSALVTSAAPVVVLPLFHRSRPLERDGLRQRLVRLSNRAGVAVFDVREWALGGQDGRAGAALVGAGATRRILLSETLLADYTDDEIEVVLAHEMGHHVNRDVLKALAAELVVLLAGFGLAAAALRAAWSWLGLSGPADMAGLPLIALVVGGVSLVATPFLNALSRHSERRADRFALELASQPDAFIGAMRRMAARNMAEERPSRVALWMFHTHPSVERRIADARQATRQAANGKAD